MNNYAARSGRRALELLEAAGFCGAWLAHYVIGNRAALAIARPFYALATWRHGRLGGVCPCCRDHPEHLPGTCPECGRYAIRGRS